MTGTIQVSNIVPENNTDCIALINAVITFIEQEAPPIHDHNVARSRLMEAAGEMEATE